MGCRGVWESVSGRDGGLVGRGGMYGMAWGLEGRWSVEKRGWNVIVGIVIYEWRGNEAWTQTLRRHS
jgi:hypothetical protein